MSKLKFRWLDADANTLKDAGSGATGVFYELGAGITATASGLKIADTEVTNGMLAGSIADAKLLNNSNFAKVDGNSAFTGANTFNTTLPTSTVTPSGDTDLSTKAYVDAVVEGIIPKAAVLVATTSALPSNTYDNGTAGVGATLTADAVGILTIDGEAISLNDEVLIKNEAGAAAVGHGMYVCTTEGTAGVEFVLTRREDNDTANQMPGATCFIHQGTINADTRWSCTNNPPVVIGTTELTFTQTGASGVRTASNGVQLVINDFQADFNSLTAAAVDVTADSIAIIDADDSSDTKKESIADLVSGVAGTVTSTALSASSGVLSLNIASLNGTVSIAGSDIFAMVDDGVLSKGTFTELGTFLAGTAATSGLASTSGVLALDIANLTSLSSPGGTDSIGVYDGANKNVALADLATMFAGTGTSSGLSSTVGEMAIDIPGLTDKATTVGADQLIISDSEDSFANKDVTFTIVGTMLAGSGATSGLASTAGVLSIDIPSLTDSSALTATNTFIIDDGANKEATFTKVGTLLAAGTNSGIAAADANLSIDLNDLAAAAIDVANDSIAILDATDNSSKKEAWADIATAIAGARITATAGVLSADGETNLSHIVTAGEVTAGYLTIAVPTVDAESVKVTPIGGTPQSNKQTIGATGGTVDFDVINLDEIHINNNGSATGLSGDIVEDDILMISYLFANS